MKYYPNENGIFAFIRTRNLKSFFNTWKGDKWLGQTMKEIIKNFFEYPRVKELVDYNKWFEVLEEFHSLWNFNPLILVHFLYLIGIEITPYMTDEELKSLFYNENSSFNFYKIYFK